MCIILNIPCIFTYTHTHIMSTNMNFRYRKSNANLVFYKMFDMNLNTQCIDIGWIFVYLLCVLQLYSCCWLQCIDARGCDVFIVDLHLFVHLSTSQAQTKAKALFPTLPFSLSLPLSHSADLSLSLSRSHIWHCLFANIHIVSLALFSHTLSFIPSAASSFQLVTLFLFLCLTFSLTPSLISCVLYTSTSVVRAGLCTDCALPLQKITHSAIFLSCKYGNRFSVCVHALVYITNSSHSCSFVRLFILARSLSTSFIRKRSVFRILMHLSLCYLRSSCLFHTNIFLARFSFVRVCFGFGELSSSHLLDLPISHSTLYYCYYTVCCCHCWYCGTVAGGAHSFMHRYIIAQMFHSSFSILPLDYYFFFFFSFFCSVVLFIRIRSSRYASFSMAM